MPLLEKRWAGARSVSVAAVFGGALADPGFRKYLRTCSVDGLENIELQRRARGANLRKEFRALIDAWIDAEVEARVASALRLARTEEPERNLDEKGAA